MHQAWILCSMPSFRLINNLKAHLLDHRQVIIERTACLRRDSNSVAGQRMIACSPVGGAASHSYARQEDRLTTFGCPPDAFSDDNRGRWHYHLEAVLYCFAALEEQDILSAGADIDGQDT